MIFSLSRFFGAFWHLGVAFVYTLEDSLARDIEDEKNEAANQTKCLQVSTKNVATSPSDWLKTATKDIPLNKVAALAAS